MINKIWATHPADKNEMNPLVIYHAKRCHDGFAAALCAWQFFGGRGDYFPMSHGYPLPDSLGRAVYVLDCALSESDLHGIEEKSRSLVVLEHREKAILELAEARLKNGFIRLDGSKSVAHLAWEYFHPDDPMPAIIRHVEDRHLCRWRYSETRGFTSHLDTEPMEFARWSQIMRLQGRDAHDYVSQGESMHIKTRHLVNSIANNAKPVILGSEAGFIANAPVELHGEVGDVLAARSGTYGLAWAADGDRIRVSLTGHKGYNTLILAQAFGGRGKPSLSSFRIPVAELPDLLGGKLDFPKRDSKNGASSLDCSEEKVLARSTFHGLWSASAFSKSYEKASWKSVHRQLINANLI